GIGTGKEQPFVSTVLPLHQVRRAALLALNGKDQCAPFWLTNMVTQDDDSVSHCSTHVKHRLLGCSVTRWTITPQASSLAPIGARGQSHHVTQAISVGGGGTPKPGPIGRDSKDFWPYRKSVRRS